MTKTPKQLISHFLLKRGIFYSTIPGYPLYSYKVSTRELEELTKSLRAYKYQPSYGKDRLFWAAGFCLFISEVYRREYGRLDDDTLIGGWSWTPFENRLGCTLSPEEHSEVVYSGLVDFWKRPIRRNHIGNRAFLGSLFSEGGLPWQLLQEETHGFGRAVRGGLKHFYHSRMSGKPLTDLIVQYEDHFPQQFKTHETRLLIAGIIEQLMYLAENYPLTETNDPSGYLDKNHPAWIEGFPIPLDEENGQRLINDWLQDAGRRRRQRTIETRKDSLFTAKHKLVTSDSNWSLRGFVTLPENVTFELHDIRLTTTRLELSIAEDNKTIANLGYIYGDIQESSVKVRFPRQLISFNRVNIESSLTLQVLENGITIHVQPIDDGAIDVNKAPLIFAETEAEWWLVATESCQLNCNKVRVRVPHLTTFGLTDEFININFSDASKGQWYESSTTHHIFIKGDSFKVSLSQTDSETLKPKLKGRAALFQSKPSIIFLGWPELRVTGYSSEDISKFTHIVNQKQVARQNLGKCFGDIHYYIKDSNGDTILQRRFGVLPPGFRLNTLPATNILPSRITLCSATTLQFLAQNGNIELNRLDNEDDTILELGITTKEPTSTLNLDIIAPGNVKPISLYLNYPYEGARIYDCDGRLILSKTLLASDMIGSRIVLSSSSAHQKRFIIQLELMGSHPPTPKRIYFVKPDSNTTELSLFSFMSDINQILSSTDEQDAKVRLSIDSDRELLRKEFHRYNGYLELSEDGFISIVSSQTGQGKIEAMLISDPMNKPISISEVTTQGVGTGQFVLPDKLGKDGPWILYPAKGSSIYFRPHFHQGKPAEIDDITPSSLHLATKLYDPKLRPTLIDDKIAEMSVDFGHSGWQYLTDLKNNYSHLPLSSFLSWHSLAHNPEALSVGLFRMEMDEGFCQKICDDLAIVWELIPIGIWLCTYQRFIKWLQTEGLPDSYINSVATTRLDLLKALVPGFSDLDSYFQTGDGITLPVLPLAQMKVWVAHIYQSLRQNQESNPQWPIDLGSELKAWINTTSYPLEIKELSKIEYMNGVTYLPIFMAHVTAGQVVASTLSNNESYLKFAIRVLSDFDRDGWYRPIHRMFLCHLIANKRP